MLSTELSLSQNDSGSRWGKKQAQNETLSDSVASGGELSLSKTSHDEPKSFRPCQTFLSNVKKTSQGKADGKKGKRVKEAKSNQHCLKGTLSPLLRIKDSANSSKTCRMFTCDAIHLTDRKRKVFRTFSDFEYFVGFPPV